MYQHEKQSESDVQNGFLKSDHVYICETGSTKFARTMAGGEGKGVVFEVNNVNRHIADVLKIPTVAGDLSNPVGTETEERPEEAHPIMLSKRQTISIMMFIYIQLPQRMKVRSPTL